MSIEEIRDIGQTEVSYLRDKIIELKASLESKEEEIKELKEEIKQLKIIHTVYEE